MKDFREVELFAWIGEDEFGSGEIGGRDAGREIEEPSSSLLRSAFRIRLFVHF
jgi:hypothetical protein